MYRRVCFVKMMLEKNRLETTAHDIGRRSTFLITLNKKIIQQCARQFIRLCAFELGILHFQSIFLFGQIDQDSVFSCCHLEICIYDAKKYISTSLRYIKFEESNTFSNLV